MLNFIKPIFSKLFLMKKLNKQQLEKRPKRRQHQRLTEQEYQKQITLQVANRSTCLRANVAATIWKDGRLISTGYNGAARGLLHCSVETCNETTPCENTIHAETNAIVNAAYFGVSCKDATLVVTLSPCKKCAGQIINAGIVEVIYLEEYRDKSGIELLESVGVKCKLMK